MEEWMERDQKNDLFEELPLSLPTNMGERDPEIHPNSSCDNEIWEAPLRFAGMETSNLWHNNTGG